MVSSILQLQDNSYCVINDILRTGIIVDVDSDASQGRDFSGEFVEARIILSLALVGFGHGGWSVPRWARGREGVLETEM